MAISLADRQRNMQEQLRTKRTQLAEAQAALGVLRTQCAQLEGALALCATLMGEEPVLPTNGAGEVEASDA